jgi:hypothetical protein
MRIPDMTLIGAPLRDSQYRFDRQVAEGLNQPKLEI